MGLFDKSYSVNKPTVNASVVVIGVLGGSGSGSGSGSDEEEDPLNTYMKLLDASSASKDKSNFSSGGGGG